MKNETLKYQPKIALKNYGLVLALMVLMFIALLVGGSSAEMILLKLPLIPLMFLAWKGIYSLYVKPIYEHKVTLRAFECSVLQALLSSMVVGMVLWETDKSVVELGKDYLLMFVWFFVLHMVILLLQVYANHKKQDT